MSDYVFDEELLETSGKLGKWIESTNYNGDSLAFCSGLDELYKGQYIIYREIIPAMLSLNKNPKNYDEASDLLDDLLSEIDKLEKLFIDAKDNLSPIIHYIGAIVGEFNV